MFYVFNLWQKLLQNTPAKYLWSWFLGLFDGDGSIYKSTKYNHRLEISSGSKQFLSQLQIVFFMRYDCYIYKAKNKNCWRLFINRKEFIQKITKKMYKNAPFYLKRKKDKFIEWGLFNK